MNELKKVKIYADGSCFQNPGPGGYGVILEYGNYHKEISGGFRLTTNNRMEIMGVIAGLQSLKSQCDVTVYTDSQYIVDGMNKGWVERWRANAWQRKSKLVPNADLWQQLLSACHRHVVTFVWIKGHAGDKLNERCDKLSKRAHKEKDLPPDIVYEGGSPDLGSLDLTDAGGDLEKGFHIRRATAVNGESIWQIYRQVVQTGVSFADDNNVKREHVITQWLSRPTISYVAIQDGEMVGAYKITTNQPGRGSHVANGTYMVKKTWQSKGIGRKLAEHSLKVAKAHDFMAMQFNFVVSTNKRAIHLWQNLGFEIIGTIPNGFRHAKLGLVDIYVMYRIL